MTRLYISAEAGNRYLVRTLRWQIYRAKITNWQKALDNGKIMRFSKIIFLKAGVNVN